MNFNVGDRVRIVREDGMVGRAAIGVTGKIFKKSSVRGDGDFELELDKNYDSFGHSGTSGIDGLKNRYFVNATEIEPLILSTPELNKAIESFSSGATRNKDDNKFDYEAFFSPLVARRRAEYMHEHRKQKDGTLRDGDNWQRGIPIPRYMKSLARHTQDAKLLFDGWGTLNPDTGEPVDMEDALCAIMFNAEGMLHELLKSRLAATRRDIPYVNDDPRISDSPSSSR